VDDVVVSVPMVPPDTVMSPATKLEDASESVNVMVSVWPDFNVPDPARVMVMVGTVVSVLMVRDDVHDVFSFPARSANVFGPTHSAAVPLATLAVGVNVAV
jgi:hypothetical protein